MDQRSSGPHEGPSTENYTKVDHSSGGLQWNLENENNHITRDKRNKLWSLRGNDGQMSRQNSVDSITSEQNRDNDEYLGIASVIVGLFYYSFKSAK